MFKKVFLITAFILISTAVQGLSGEVGGGEDVYNERCAKCHGTKGSGTDKGPPLVHKIYRPGHHSDYSLRLAVRNGVRSHHWLFGDMPPVKGLNKEEVEMIIKYVRALQREAGIL